MSSATSARSSATAARDSAIPARSSAAAAHASAIAMRLEPRLATRSATLLPATPAAPVAAAVAVAALDPIIVRATVFRPVNIGIRNTMRTPFHAGLTHPKRSIVGPPVCLLDIFANVTN